MLLSEELGVSIVITNAENVVLKTLEDLKEEGFVPDEDNEIETDESYLPAEIFEDEGGKTLAELMEDKYYLPFTEDGYETEDGWMVDWSFFRKK